MRPVRLCASSLRLWPLSGLVGLWTGAGAGGERAPHLLAACGKRQKPVWFAVCGLQAAGGPSGQGAIRRDI